MKRTEFIQVVKIFSFWKIDRRKGNYTLPNGERLSTYLYTLTEQLLERNGLAIRSDGNIGEVLNGRIFVPFGTDEIISTERQTLCIRNLVWEMLY